jgi:hypothetical protein
VSPTYDILNGSVPITMLAAVDTSDLAGVKAIAQQVSAGQGKHATISVVDVDGAPAPVSHPVALFYGGREVHPDAFVRGDDLA